MFGIYHFWPQFIVWNTEWPHLAYIWKQFFLFILILLKKSYSYIHNMMNIVTVIRSRKKKIRKLEVSVKSYKSRICKNVWIINVSLAQIWAIIQQPEKLGDVKEKRYDKQVIICIFWIHIINLVIIIRFKKSLNYESWKVFVKSFESS